LIYVAKLLCPAKHVLASSACEAPDTEDEKILEDLAFSAQEFMIHNLQATGNTRCTCGEEPDFVSIGKTDSSSIDYTMAVLHNEMISSLLKLKTPNCPFYGRHMFMSQAPAAGSMPFILMEQNGNQCGLITDRHAACELERDGQAVEWSVCPWVRAVRCERD